MDTVRGEEGKVEMYGESNMETYIIICKLDSQWEFAVWLRELKQGLCDNLEGCEGEGEGRTERHGCTYSWFLLIYDRKPQNAVKQLSLNLKLLKMHAKY